MSSEMEVDNHLKKTISLTVVGKNRIRITGGLIAQIQNFVSIVIDKKTAA